MIALVVFTAMLAGQSSSWFTSVDDWVCSSFSDDYLNSIGLPKEVHEALLKTYEQSDPDRDAKYRARQALAKSAFAGLPETEKRLLRLRIYRLVGILSLRFSEIHAMLGTTTVQQASIQQDIARIDLPGIGPTGKNRVDMPRQCRRMIERLDLGRRLRETLSHGQRVELAKLLGSEVYLTSYAGGTYITSSRFNYKGNLSEPRICQALGFSEEASTEIRDTYNRLGMEGGWKGELYLKEIELDLGDSRRKRYEELKLQAKGGVAILRGRVAAEIGLTAVQIEEITRATIALSVDRIIEGSELHPLPSTLVDEDLAAYRKLYNAMIFYEAETYALLERVIRDQLTEDQWARWMNMQGHPVPGITYAGIAKRFATGGF